MSALCFGLALMEGAREAPGGTKALARAFPAPVAAEPRP